MGCDIHSYAEVLVEDYRREGDDSPPGQRWLAVGNVFENDYYRPEAVTTISVYDDDDEPVYESNKRYSIEPYRGRNYTLFALLANVRNSGEVTPIDDPRGLPQDVTGYVLQEAERWGYDGHSHSWFLLAELQAFEWDTPFQLHGVVSENQYAVFKQEGSPRSWCGGISGANVVMVANEKMDALIAGAEHDPGQSYYTSITWTDTYRDCCRSFVEKTIPALEELLAKERVKDVRLVFWFDN